MNVRPVDAAFLSGHASACIPFSFVGDNYSTTTATSLDLQGNANCCLSSEHQRAHAPDIFTSCCCDGKQAPVGRKHICSLLQISTVLGIPAKKWHKKMSR